MDKKEVSEVKLRRLMDLLRHEPELYEKMLDIAQMKEFKGSQGLPSVDELEESLIPKIRKLGQETMRSCLQSVEEAVADETKHEVAKVRQREKKRSK